MTGWSCPACGTDAVCSLREWTAVYDYRAALEEAGRRLARQLHGYGVQPRPSEDASDVRRRWADGTTDGPRYVCASCVTPYAAEEVAP